MIITWESMCEENFHETFPVSRYICLAGQDESILGRRPQFLYSAAVVCLHHPKPTCSLRHSCQWSSCQQKGRQGCRSLCWRGLRAWFLYSSLWRDLTFNPGSFVHNRFYILQIKQFCCLHMGNEHDYNKCDYMQDTWWRRDNLILIKTIPTLSPIYLVKFPKTLELAYFQAVEYDQNIKAHDKVHSPQN